MSVVTAAAAVECAERTKNEPSTRIAADSLNGLRMR